MRMAPRDLHPGGIELRPIRKRVSRAHEFTIEDMVEPVRAGLAAATSQCVVAGLCKKDPLRVQLR
jgi:hypothetical protein